MVLKPIPGAPVDAPIPDFPSSTPAPLIVPAFRSPHRPAPLPTSLPPAAMSPARRQGPIQIRGDGDRTLTFRCIPEVPAINRSSMTIAVTGEPADLPQTRPHIDLAIDEAKAFLLALRDGHSPIVVTDSRTAFQVEFAIAADGPTFTVSNPGQTHAALRFNAGWSYDVKAMAEQLLADLGP